MQKTSLFRGVLFGATLALGLATLALGAAACGDDDDTVPPGGDGGGDGGGGDGAMPDAGPPQPITMAEVCDPADGVFVDFIEKLLSCRPEFTVFFGTTLPTSSELSMACNGSLQPYIDDGTVTLGDSATLAACRDYIANTGCEALEFDAPNPCDGLFVGTVAGGGLCDDDNQCAGSSYCDKSGGPGCGACAPRKADGANCNENSECANGRCNGMNACAAYGGVGDACTSGDDCAGTSVCDPTTLLCKLEPTWAVGTPCMDFIDCDAITGDLYCDQGLGTCRAYLALGATCGMATALCDILEYEHCQPMGMGAGTCVAGTQVADGQTCGFFQGRECMSGSRCVNDDGDPMTPDICVTPLGIGDPCDASNNLCDLFMECVAGACQYGNYTAMCPVP